MSISENALRLLPSHRQPVPAASLWRSRLKAGFDRIRTAWVTRRQQYRDVQLLRGFSDRELSDLGLSRFDISAVARRTYRRD
jgi:uncharacterized protein YjiS (DUF1127 family)